MEIANMMKNITENIIASYDMRMKALNDLISNTQRSLKGFTLERKAFSSDRKKMGKEQAEMLSDFAEGLSKSSGDMLNGFHMNHKHMSEEQSKRLVDFTKNLSKDVGSMVNNFQKFRCKTSRGIKNKLTRELKGIKASVGNILSDTRELLGEYNSDMERASHAWLGMSKNLAAARRNRTAASLKRAEEVLAEKRDYHRKGKTK